MSRRTRFQFQMELSTMFTFISPRYTMMPLQKDLVSLMSMLNLFWWYSILTFTRRLEVETRPTLRIPKSCCERPFLDHRLDR